MRLIIDNIEIFGNSLNHGYTTEFIKNCVNELIYVYNETKYVWWVKSHTINVFYKNMNINCISIGDFKYDHATISDFKNFIVDLTNENKVIG